MSSSTNRCYRISSVDENYCRSFDHFTASFSSNSHKKMFEQDEKDRTNGKFNQSYSSVNVDLWRIWRWSSGGNRSRIVVKWQTKSAIILLLITHSIERWSKHQLIKSRTKRRINNNSDRFGTLHFETVERCTSSHEYSIDSTDNEIQFQSKSQTHVSVRKELLRHISAWTVDQSVERHPTTEFDYTHRYGIITFMRQRVCSKTNDRGLIDLLIHR